VLPLWVLLRDIITTIKPACGQIPYSDQSLSTVKFHDMSVSLSGIPCMLHYSRHANIIICTLHLFLKLVYIWLTVSQKNSRPLRHSGKASRADVGNFRQRQLQFTHQFICSWKVTSLLLLRTIWVSMATIADDWWWRCGLTLNRRLLTTPSACKEDFCVKAKGEHLEHLLWLAVAYCVLLRCIVSNNLNVSLSSSTQRLRMTHNR